MPDFIRRILRGACSRLPAHYVARLIAGMAPPAVMRDKRFFSLWERQGYHVTPVHFYEPIPDTRTLADDHWEGRQWGDGIDFNEAAQMELLQDFARRYREEYDAFPLRRTDDRHVFYLDQEAFRSVDAEILYCMIRHFSPRHIIEIGSGFSTLLAASAIRKNAACAGAECRLTCIEPYPLEFLRDGIPGVPGFSLVRAPAQSVPLEKLDELGRNDILFIDSSHVLAVGSDVQYEYLKILPRLRPGVIVHVHDIFLPVEYPKRWVKEEHRFWNEQSLLHAFLLFNRAFQVMWASSYMHLNHSAALQSAFRSYQPGQEWPGSFWMRRVS